MPHKLSSTHLINQADTSIYYPNTSTSAFTDKNFYGKLGKTGASGTIKDFGCAICSLGMYILYKGGLSNATKSNVYYAVVEATSKGTNNDADYTASSFTAKIGSQSIGVNITKINDVSEEAENGNVCMVRLELGKEKSHYLIVDGFDSSASGFDRYLVADPDGGKQKTLADTMRKRDFPVAASSITEKYKLS